MNYLSICYFSYVFFYLDTHNFGYKIQFYNHFLCMLRGIFLSEFKRSLQFVMRRYPANSWFLLKVNSNASLFFAPFSFKYVLLLFVFHFHAFGITIFVSKYIHRIRHYCIFTAFVVLFSCLVFDKLNKWSENELLILFIILLFDPGPLTSCHLHASCPDCIPPPPPPIPYSLLTDTLNYPAS